MWINPKYAERHPAPASTAEAPRDDGIRLATLPRTARGLNEELRISLAEYQGHRYLSLRVWSLDRRSGQWFPVKGKGLSVKLREAADVAGTLLDGLRMAQEQEDDPPRPAGRPPVRGQARPDRHSGDFDEFG